MSIIAKLLSAIKGSSVLPAGTAKPAYSIPTVKFDRKRVAETVKADLRDGIKSIKDFKESHFPFVYDAALRSIEAGRDLGSLTKAIIELDLPGMTKGRAGEISLFLNDKATALINQEQQIALGIERAVWAYSGAPCMLHPQKPSRADIEQNEAHKSADGKEYEIAKGMYLNGRWTQPGRNQGCKCFSKSLIPGINS